MLSVAPGQVGFATKGNLIESCVVSDNIYPSGGGLGVGGIALAAGIVRDCLISDCTIALGSYCWAADSLIFENNTVSNCEYGMNFDSPPFDNTTIRGNTFITKNYGIVMVNVTNFIVEGNTFKLGNSVEGIHLSLNDANVVIRNNQFINISASGSGNPCGINFYNTGTGPIIIHGNRMDRGIVNNTSLGLISLCHDNTTFDGAALIDLS